jgi:16S rRNA (cytosine967-C5)-methyltransferase
MNTLDAAAAALATILSGLEEGTPTRFAAGSASGESGAARLRGAAGVRHAAREAARQAGHDSASMPGDQRLRDFFRQHPGLGKRDRLQIGDWVFDVLRNLRLYEALARRQAAPVQAATIGTTEPPDPTAHARRLILLAQAAEPLPGFDDLPEPVRFSLPDWLWERLQAAYGDRATSIAAALLLPSPIDLRANLLKGKAEVLRQKLADRGVEAVAIDQVPTGLRVAGRPNLEKLDLFEQGWFEIQDAGSQRIVDFSEPRRGQLVVDFCAGAGGKTLAIAARMRNVGKVLAFDTGEERLSRLMPRARRAGADIANAMRIDGVQDPRLARYFRRADVVLVDAPCSGTGTLRRSPDMKWRLTAARVAQHVQEQRAILVAAAKLVKPGGKLVYATCSLLQEENEQQVDWFAEAGFDLIEMKAWLPDEGPSSGFFVAKWLLRGPE